MHKQIVAVYGDVMNQNVMKWCREFSEGVLMIKTKKGVAGHL
jgi:hypothetical protein